MIWEGPFQPKLFHSMKSSPVPTVWVFPLRFPSDPAFISLQHPRFQLALG